MPSMTERSEYVLEPIREGVDFTLFRGQQDDNSSPVLVVALTAEEPSPQGLRRLEHEYSLAVELDPAWSAKPLALTRYEGRTILILTDPGGEPLDLVLERDQGQPLDLTRVLRIAIGSATTTAPYGSPASALRPTCRTSARRPRRRKSLRAPSPTWRPNRPAA